MNLLFVTGATRAYFPTLLVLLQSFAEQIGGNPPCVCDYGLDTGQRHFLRRIAVQQRPEQLAQLGDHAHRAIVIARED